MLCSFRELVLLCCCIACSVQLSAQLQVMGTVTDSAGSGLPFANVVLLHAVDSSLAAFASTDKKGGFKLSLTSSPGEFLMRISFVGYESNVRNLVIDEHDQLLDLGRISLMEQGYLLDGAVINGFRIPIRMRGDTVVFDADAFATGPNAVVDDLLRQLPGLSIQQNGSILFRGRQVREVMVNGRPFFRGNTQLLTQNLDAAAVDKVEVYDRKSAAETVSGEDDGHEDLALNLTIKPEAEGDPFGEVYAGAGSSNRYRAGGKAFRINGTRQLGAVATANNLNQTGLSFSDLASIGQGGSSLGGFPMQHTGQVLGDNRTLAGGFNSSSPTGKHANTTLSYLLYDVSEAANAIETNRYADSRLGEQVITSERETHNNFHRVSADYEYQRDTSAWLTLRIDGQLAGRRLANQSFVRWEQQSDTSAYSQFDTGRDRLPRLASRLDYSQRLRKLGGRSLAFTHEVAFVNERERLATGIAGLGIDPAILNDGDRLWNSTFKTWRNDGQVSLKERLSKDWTATAALEYTSEHTQSEARLERSELETNEYQIAYFLLNPNVRIRRQLGDGHISVGVGRQLVDWRLSKDLSRRISKGYWAPYFSYASTLKTGQLGFTINGQPELPQVGDLVELPQPREVNEVRVGSPRLGAAYRYQASGRYMLFNQFAGFNLFANARAAHIESAIGHALDLRGAVPVSQAVNLKYAREYSGYVQLGQLFAPLRAKASINGSLTNRTGPAILNGSSTSQQATSWMAGMRVQRSIGKDGYVSIGYQVEQRWSAYGESERVAASTRAFSLTGEMPIKERLRIETDFTQQHFSSSSSGSSPARLPLWQLSLEWIVWKNKPHYLKVTAADLLDQNRGVEQEVLDFLVRETEGSVLGRYVLVSAHWRL